MDRLLKLMPLDKWLHLALGVLAILAMLTLDEVARRYGDGAATALGTTLLGVAYEALQRLRHEGHPDPLDALATAAPGWVFWAAHAALT